MKKFIFIIYFLFNSCDTEKAIDIELNNLFQDNMVIQHNSVTPIWGTTKPNRRIKIEISWGDKYETVSDSIGNWRIDINTPQADKTSHTIEINTSNDKIILKNILLGEVWLASGQSNMQWRMKQAENKDDLSSTSFENDEIRMINVNRSLSLKPLSNFSGKWKVCNPTTISDFSAVGYFFAKKLHDELKIPIGIINSSVGGTPAEAWSNIRNLEKVAGFENLRERFEISIDPLNEYNTWLNEHNYINRNEFINKNDFKYVNEKNRLFSQLTYDDSNWVDRTIEEINTIFKKKKVDLNQYSPSYNRNDDFDGIVWIRKDFELTEKNDQSYYIDIGDFEDTGDFYSIFINEELVGRKINWSKKSTKYKIRDGLLKNGLNNISIRIIDFYGNGGLINDKKIGLYSNEKKIKSFDGLWKSKFVGWLTNENLYVLKDGFNDVLFPSPLRISKNQSSHTLLNNSMIYPLGDFMIKGVIWYQGEGNRTRAQKYKDVFSAVIDSFREQWKNKDLPFYYVQLAPFGDIAYKRRFKSEFVAELREAQRLTLKKNHVGMAIIMDVGDSLDIHPLPKKPVGDRLALLALANDYGYDNLVFSGPLYKDVSFVNNSALISFKNADSGLLLKNNNLSQFELAGSDKKFFSADAKILDEKVLVKSNDVINPKYVRYGWKNFLYPTLFNKEGLPASSFSSLKNPFSR